MHLDDLYPSKWLNASSLTDDLDLTINKLDMHVFDGDEEASPILYFKEIEQGLTLNVTNARTVAGLHGPETDQWPGKRITLYRTEVEYKGNTTWGIRVKLTAPVAAQPEPAASEAEIPF